MTRILLTGATGYVGGEVLYTLDNSNLGTLQITCLVRDEKKALEVQAVHPNIKTVLGDLDDVALVQREAEAADIVLHLAATGHAPSAKAIAQGLQDRAKRVQSPGHWVQISGATCFATEEIASGKFGYATDAIYDDSKDRDRILSTLRSNSKRIVENIVLSQSPSLVKTALIVGPLIYGPGRGPVNQRSIQAPEIVKSTLKLGHGFRLNDGKNIWSNIHVHDLASLVVLLVSAAKEGKDGLWNDDGVYNVENGEMTFEQLDTVITNEAHAQGLIKEDATSGLKVIDAAKADSLSGHAAILWGTNARTRAVKGRHALDWSPSGSALVDTIPELVRAEGKGLKASL
ncbi:NAD dependent epimerase/dehydratase family protein [Pyrenochaeta sp. MPI-SDFR-AT-0127]|nr:NAD dependent epimerase/dehydratase family protein [Pyrenochaeta sp. MPI-SDFR-AT-0127]